MARTCKILIFFILIICLFSKNGLTQSALRTWDIFEITLKSPVIPANPYISLLEDGKPPFVIAKFTCVSGEGAGKSIIAPGFWDGNDVWKIRFTPPLPGIWKFETNSVNRKLNGKKGQLTVTGWTAVEKNENPVRHGFIIVNKSDERNGRYFTYTDGTPVLWIADTWWDWTNRRITFESFKNLVDTRASQGYNIGQLFFAGNGWGRESSLLDQTFQNPDLEQIRKVEKMIVYANSRGITVWIHPWWTRQNMNKNIGAENIRRWWRYVIHRLHPYNVIWVLSGEYNMNNYGGFPLSFWNELGTLVKSEDPYDRILGAHPTPPMWDGGAEAPQWSTAEAVHEQQWLDYNQSQCGHARWCNELIPWIVTNAYAKNPAKPVVVTEPWYEFIEGNPTARDIRYAAWSSVMTGAAGHTYGGGHIWRAHLPERPTGKGSWPLDTGFIVNTMLYPGAISVGFMGQYLRKLEWWKLEPHPELVRENPSHFCLAIPGKEYLFYLRYGGSVKIDLSAFPVTSEFTFVWTDLVNSSESKSGVVSGGKMVEIKCPEDYPGFENFKDWILHLKISK
jgi:hypothetical protein